MSEVYALMEIILAELGEAKRKYPDPHNSPHESYAILLEELDEVWDAIKANDGEQTRAEMIQVAAGAIRFLLEVSDKVWVSK
jgi:NTP pyrophosphatase (non-canonical NTP hydrolase)